MMFTSEYTPKTVDELFLSKEDLLRLKRMILERRPVILNGPTGCGKTSIAHVIAKELDYDIFELNASDERSQKNLEISLVPSTKEGSLLFKGRLILIDDVEALSGTKDRGGLSAITKIIEESKWPIVITTSDIHDYKFSKLKSKCGLIELSKIDDQNVFDVLRKICESESIIYDPLTLKELTDRSQGDLRAAINDLQSLSFGKQLDSLEGLGYREKEKDILESLKTIFKMRDIDNIINSFNDANIDLDEATLWLDENIPLEYTERLDLLNAYDNLSKADVFNGRIKRWQYWRFLVYRNFFLTVGVSLSKSRDYLNFFSYRRSSRLLKLFWAKQKNMKKKAIAEKVAEKAHASIKKVLKDVFPYFQIIYKNGQEVSDIGLDKEEVEWLKKQ